MIRVYLQKHQLHHQLPKHQQMFKNFRRHHHLLLHLRQKPLMLRLPLLGRMHHRRLQMMELSKHSRLKKRLFR